VKPVNLTAKTEMARAAADYINSLANANGFSTATTNEELNQYVHWFSNQIRECDKYIASSLVIEVSYQ
jgi:hypothetical protein